MARGGFGHVGRFSDQGNRFFCFRWGSAGADGALFRGTGIWAMSTERNIDEEAVFTAARAIAEADQRAAYLQQACAGDAALLQRLEALLQVQARERSVLEEAAASLQLTLDVPSIVEGPGTMIGRYKLLEKIGEGGMAVVYMAEQQHPVRRRVALKIIKLGMDTKQVVGRFEAERQALALMDHPNIAHVFDGGATETGRPYFVMELVRGVAISEYCDKNRLSTRERLELFVQVCNAVQHAHQKGIIHRDLKPSNVMVTLHDGRPVPKVIDFGIAKAINQRLTEHTLFTRYSQMIGTPEYMSPEQAEMSGLDIDTRTDIYSLGVLLYELLTGTTPFPGETLRSAGYAEMQRIIRETDPLKPSTRIRTLGQTLPDVAQFRRTTPEALRKLVKGDLDWIVMKTLEKDRTLRYETAHALAEDIERHLRHEPIQAGSPSTVYRMQKFLRRHRARLATLSAATVVVAGLLLAGITYARLHAQRTRDSHQKTLAMVEDRLSRGEYESALREVKPILTSRFVGPKARLLQARVLLELQGPDVGVKQLQGLVKERAEIAANAHFLLAWIYLEAAPNDPRMKTKAQYHLQRGEKLMPRTAEAFLLRAMTAQTVRETLGWLDNALEIDPTHYGARRARALAYCALGEYRRMETEASTMIGGQPGNPAGHLLRAIARRELALASPDAQMLDDALADHDYAVGLTAPHDKRQVELYDQRRQTLVRMGRYGPALADTEACIRLQPEEPTYHFNLFCLLTALGKYPEAQAVSDKICGVGEESRLQFNLSAARYVFDSLSAGRSWYPRDNVPQGTAFDAMHRAAEEYRQLAALGRRIVAEGFHPTWSPDGTQLAYSRGVLGASGLEILDLRTGKTRLLTIPGKDPAWSPDGRFIAYVRDRQVLSLADLTTVREGTHRPFDQEEVWIARVDGTEPPRFLARGGWPNWNRDATRIYYQSPAENKVFCVTVDANHQQQREIFTCVDMFPVVSPDEKYIAVMTNDGVLQVTDLTTKSVVARWPWPRYGEQLFPHWSADARYLSIGCYWGAGLWIYDLEKKEASKVIDGSFAWCSWPNADRRRMALDKVYAQWHHEIWMIDRPVDPPPAVRESQSPSGM
jgi:serine/threonine protein kinase/tetratricopeptide (TPR) repeat protein